MQNKPLFILSLSSCSQLDGSPKQSMRQGLVCGSFIGESELKLTGIGSWEVGNERRESQDGGAHCYRQLNLDLDGTHYTSEVFSQGMREGTVFPLAPTLPWSKGPHGMSALSHFQVCLGQNG